MKTIGILGGMGPAATCDLMEKIIGYTAAARDQEHIPMLADVNTRIPDRTAAILNHGADPLPEMLATAGRLEAAGADFLIIPCNTAHYFYDCIQEKIGIPLLHMPRLTAQTLRKAGVKKAGVLATDGTVQSGVYAAALAAEGVEPVYPETEDQQQIMRLIYDGVKARRLPLSEIPVRDILRRMRAAGAEKFLLACTELPLAFQELGISEDCLDPTRVLALAAAHTAGAKTVTDSPW